jgi:hypothetical protein
LLFQPFGHFGLDPDTDFDSPPLIQVRTTIFLLVFAFGILSFGIVVAAKVVGVLVEVVAFDTGKVTAV